MGNFRKVLAAIAISSAVAGVAYMVPTSPAAAAGLTEVTDFGDNPGDLQMHLYVPDTLDAKPAIVVAMHFCGGSGPEFFNSNSDFSKLADQHGFILIYPSATQTGTQAKCFDASSAASKVRGGGSDPGSIESMVKFTLAEHNGDPKQVFVTGSSSGGMETNVMMALYPDMFAAGSAYMGVPFGCFRDESDFVPVEGASDCASGRVTKTPQEWGDLVRGAFPGFNGPTPRIQLWHGEQDTFVDFKNLQSEVDQWTNVYGVDSSTPTVDEPQPGWTRRTFNDASGTTRVQAISVAGAKHTLPANDNLMAAAAIKFFGLDN